MPTIWGFIVNKADFNRACAEYMGYHLSWPRGWAIKTDTNEIVDKNYNPHDDLNQMAEVVDKAMKNMEQLAFAGFLDDIVRCDSIKQALRNFIAQTLED